MTPKEKSEDIAKAGKEFHSRTDKYKRYKHKTKWRELVAIRIARKHDLSEAFFVPFITKPVNW